LPDREKLFLARNNGSFERRNIPETHGCFDNHHPGMAFVSVVVFIPGAGFART
jgi:hypothetical protein